MTRWLIFSFIVISFFIVKMYSHEGEPIVSVILDFIIIMALSYWFVVPYIKRESMRVPGYSFELVRRRDDFLRIVSFVVAVVVALSILIF